MKKWKTLKKEELLPLEVILETLEREGFFLSDWILDVFQRRGNIVFARDIDLYRVSLGELGVKGAVELRDVYTLFTEQGFDLVDPQVSLYARRAYVEQPTGEWLRIAVPLDSMIDSDGVPHLPKLGAGLSRFYVETYWAWPNAIFHPHNEFIVAKMA
jgi:hypothetical protein